MNQYLVSYSPIATEHTDIIIANSEEEAANVACNRYYGKPFKKGRHKCTIKNCGIYEIEMGQWVSVTYQGFVV